MGQVGGEWRGGDSQAPVQGPPVSAGFMPQPPGFGFRLSFPSCLAVISHSTTAERADLRQVQAPPKTMLLLLSLLSLLLGGEWAKGHGSRAGARWG